MFLSNIANGLPVSIFQLLMVVASGCLFLAKKISRLPLSILVIIVTMVFCYQNCSDLLWKNCSSYREKILKFEAESREFSKFLRLLEINSNSERSEQFLVTECFFNLFLEISQISKNRTIIIQIGKNYWDLEICRKS